jgi:hypothetical protein
MLMSQDVYRHPLVVDSFEFTELIITHMNIQPVWCVVKCEQFFLRLSVVVALLFEVY